MSHTSQSATHDTCQAGLIAPAGPSDAVAIAELVNRAYRPEAGAAGWTHESALIEGERTSAQQVQALFGPHALLLAMKHGTELKACVHIECDGSDCWIGMLATCPSAQNTGMGKRMLQAAEAAAQHRFAPQRLLMTVLTSRPELLGFYQRRGYVLTGETMAYPMGAGVGVPRSPDLQLLVLAKPVTT